MIYIVIFIFSIILMKRAYIIYVSNKDFDIDNYTSVKIIYTLFFSFLPLLLLATFRDLSIGYDVRVYQYSLSQIAERSNSLRDYYAINFVGQNMEPLYAFCTYVGTKIAGMKGVFFINEFLVLIFTYAAIWKLKDYIVPQKILACFLFIYYLHTFDIIRQSIAMSIIFYTYTRLRERKYISSIILVIIAFMFHKSAILGIGIVFLYYVSVRNLRWFYGALVLLAVGAVSFSYRQIFVFLFKFLPFLPERYIDSRYLSLEGGVDINVAKLIYIIIGLGVLLIAYYLHANEIIDNYTFLLYMMILAVARITVGSQAEFAYRAFLYPEYFSIMVVPQYEYLLKQEKGNFMIGEYLFYGFLLFYCVFFFMIRNVGETYPYILNKM